MKWILGWYGLLGLVTFLTFGWDKWRATRHGRRVRERTLHLMEAAGGIVGALVAMTAFRHKRRKTRFLLVSWTIAALHAGAWIGWWWWTTR